MEFSHTKDKKTQKLKFDSKNYQFEYFCADGRSTKGSIGKLRRAKYDYNLTMEEKLFIKQSLEQFDLENRKDSTWIKTYIRFGQAEYKVELNDKTSELRIKLPSLLYSGNSTTIGNDYSEIYNYYKGIIDKQIQIRLNENREYKSDSLDCVTNMPYLALEEFKVEDFEFSIAFNAKIDLVTVCTKERTVIAHSSTYFNDYHEFRSLHYGYLRFHIENFIKNQTQN